MRETPKKSDDEAPQRRQASAAVARQRVEELVRVLLDGAIVEWDVCEFVREMEEDPNSAWKLQENEKPLSYSQIRRYVVKADKLIAESCRASRKKLVRRHLAQRRNLYAKAVNAGDIRTALAVVRDEAELLGIYPAKGPPTEGKKHADLTDAERLAALQNLQARVGAPDGGPPADGTDDADGPLLDRPGEDPGGRGFDA